MPDWFELPPANVVGANLAEASSSGTCVVTRGCDVDTETVLEDVATDRVEGAGDCPEAGCFHDVAARSELARFAEDALTNKGHTQGTFRSDRVVAAVRARRYTAQHSAVREDPGGRESVPVSNEVQCRASKACCHDLHGLLSYTATGARIGGASEVCAQIQDTWACENHALGSLVGEREGAGETIFGAAEDEMMISGKYEDAVHAVKPSVDVKVIEGINHMGIVTNPRAISVIAEDVATRGAGQS